MSDPVSLMFPGEPIGSWAGEDIDALLLWACDIGASDICIASGQVAWVRVHGEWRGASKRPISDANIEILLGHVSRNPATAGMVRSGRPADLGYDIVVDRWTRRRFRGNATAIRVDGGTGTTMVLRTIPGVPPELDTLEVDQGILDAVFPTAGLVLITGVMGSGKTTLLAAVMRRIIETQPRHITTYEEPIEFDFSAIENPKGPVCQSAVPDHVDAFHNAPRNAARRASDIILVGESRDAETLRGMIETAEMGVAAYSTVHTRSVEETPARIINVFPATERQGIATTMAYALRLIVQQRLVPRASGVGRVALREFVALSQSMRNTLANAEYPRYTYLIREMCATHGQTLLQDATRKFEAGLISEQVYQEIRIEKEVDGIES
jgi:defect-in-organelle-trafficking protein DotB